MDPKELLQIVIIPVSLGLIALIWPGIQAWYRRRNFERLILRELLELSPYPAYPERGTREGWWQHCGKRFIHADILKDPSANRDFILSLDPDLVYYLTQLWYSLEKKNWDQWEYAFQNLDTKYVKKPEFSDHKCAWEKPHLAYERNSAKAERNNSQS